MPNSIADYTMLAQKAKKTGVGFSFYLQQLRMVLWHAANLGNLSGELDLLCGTDH